MNFLTNNIVLDFYLLFCAVEQVGMDAALPELHHGVHQVGQVGVGRLLAVVVVVVVVGRCGRPQHLGLHGGGDDGLCPAGREVGEHGVLGAVAAGPVAAVEVRLLLELLVDAEVGEVLHVGRHLGERVRLVLLLDLRVDAALARRLVQLPLRYLFVVQRKIR